MTEKQWELRYHRSRSIAEGTKSVDVFALHYGAKTLVMFLPQPGQELAVWITKKLNANGEPWVPEKELLEIKGMLAGPWYPSSTGVQCLQLSDDETKRVKNYLFKMAADKAVIDAAFQALKAEHNILLKRNQILEQEILASRGRLDPEAIAPQTISDLFDDEDEPTPELPFAHHSQVLCPSGGCGEV